MIDRNELDLRVNAHWNQIDTVNQTQWQPAAPTHPADSLRQQIATALVFLASKLDNPGIASEARNQTGKQSSIVT